MITRFMGQYPASSNNAAQPRFQGLSKDQKRTLANVQEGGIQEIQDILDSSVSKIDKRREYLEAQLRRQIDSLTERRQVEAAEKALSENSKLYPDKYDIRPDFEVVNALARAYRRTQPQEKQSTDFRIPSEGPSNGDEIIFG